MTKNSAEYRSWFANRWATLNRQRYLILGIHMCPAWANDFQVFLKDMGRKPSPRHRLTRLDPSDDFNAQNCIWALPEDIPYIQNQYRKFMVNGVPFSYRELSEMHGINLSTIRSRTQRKHEVTLQELTEPTRKYRSGEVHTSEGVFESFVAAATALNLVPNTVYKRLSRGDSPERALRG